MLLRISRDLQPFTSEVDDSDPLPIRNEMLEWANIKRRDQNERR